MALWTRRWKQFLEEQILANWQYKLIALGAALIIWSYVTGLQSMQVVFTAPIRFQNIPAGSKIIDQKMDAAEVTLSGNRALILSLKRHQVWVSLDLSGLRNGRNLYLISSREVMAPAGIEVKDITPRQLSIQLASE